MALFGHPPLSPISDPSTPVAAKTVLNAPAQQLPPYLIFINQLVLDNEKLSKDKQAQFESHVNLIHTLQQELDRSNLQREAWDSQHKELCSKVERLVLEKDELVNSKGSLVDLRNTILQQHSTQLEERDAKIEALKEELKAEQAKTKRLVEAFQTYIAQAKDREETADETDDDEQEEDIGDDTKVDKNEAYDSNDDDELEVEVEDDLLTLDALDDPGPNRHFIDEEPAAKKRKLCDAASPHAQGSHLSRTCPPTWSNLLIPSNTELSGGVPEPDRRSGLSIIATNGDISDSDSLGLKVQHAQEDHKRSTTVNLPSRFTFLPLIKASIDDTLEFGDIKRISPVVLASVCDAFAMLEKRKDKLPAVPRKLEICMNAWMRAMSWGKVSWTCNSPRRFACKTCYNCRRTCILWYGDKRCVLLPLPPDVRHSELTYTDVGYYLRESTKTLQPDHFVDVWEPASKR